MDVEGFEYEVLKGADNILSSETKPYWIIEVWSQDHQSKPNPAFSNIFSLMQAHGYTSWGIDEGANQLTPFTSNMARKVEDGKIKCSFRNFLFIAGNDDLVLRLQQ